MARLVRSQVLSLRETNYVLAAKAIGGSTSRILFRHLLPELTNLMVVTVTLSLGAVALAEVRLTFLGIGVEDRASFGIMISQYAGPDERTRTPAANLRARAGGRALDAFLQPPRRCADRRLLAAAEVTLGDPRSARRRSRKSRPIGASSPVGRQLSVSCASTSRPTSKAFSGATPIPVATGMVTGGLTASGPRSRQSTRSRRAGHWDARDGRRGGGATAARREAAIVGTTNDNTRALNFYIKRGYRLVRLHLDAMDRVRALKPGVPATGREECPCRTCGSWRRRCSNPSASRMMNRAGRDIDISSDTWPSCLDGPLL